MIAGVSECRRVGGAVDGVAAEHAAEEQDLSGQEQPHAESGGVLLLLDVVELVAER